MTLLIYLALTQQAVAPDYFPKFYERVTERCKFLDSALPRLSTFESEWYGKELRAADEPSLLKRAYTGHADSLRFLWLRSFDPAVVVRIEGLGGSAPQLTAVEFDSADRYGPLKIHRRIARTLTGAEAAELRRRLIAQNPLALPIGSNPCEGGIDGSQWIIERAAGHRYKMVNAWSPERGPIYAAGVVMLHLTGWKFPAVY